MLHDALEVISRMLEPGSDPRDLRGHAPPRADAQQRPEADPARGMPIMVGGNGPKVTWRLAARYADELNLDGLSPDEVREALPTIRARCEEIDRDPTRSPSRVHAWWGTAEWAEAGARDASCCAPTPSSA